ncbi:hypothetical protein FSP39_007739 [Pinctada imbricata]|uniref:OLD protein-like TOPRIM domain-containing protein n=1 Tax=Pinctada imbricata TaxID=66713 RepID=A0AA88YAS2_PINIB|nr:hypothetical protein FSP39_007739 [Pinctada imbricata]
MINFKDRQVLKFEKGVNFLIGANATGKSSILELIRRCHSKRLNSSASNLHDKTKPGFIICKYDYCSEVLGDVQLGIDIKEIERDVALLCYFQEKNFNGSNIIHKCVCFRGKNREIYIAVSREKGEVVDEQELRKYTRSDFEKIDDFFTIYFENKEIDQGVDTSEAELSFLGGIKSSLQNTTVIDNNSHCQTEDILNPLSRAFAFIFANRSFGPLQWINGNTSNVEKLNARQNYKKARKRAEILWELLPTDEEGALEFRRKNMEAGDTIGNCSTSPPNMDHDESAYIDEEKEKTYFDLMTYPLEYQFKKSLKEIKIKVNMVKDDREVEFVKAPEGVIESKQASLVFSHRKFKTICYEDIERGMHDQMVENLNNLVLKKIEDKIVIIVTHNPSFMTGWAMEKTHICSRQKSDKLINVVRKVPSGYKFGVHDEMKRALFAARVLLVEGSTDQQALKPLFEYIVENEEAQRIIGDKLEKERPYTCIVRQICKTQILFFGGKGMENAIKFCNKISIPILSLRDADAKNKKCGKNDHFWKCGTIEDVLRNDCPETIREALSWCKRRDDSDVLEESVWESFYKSRLKGMLKRKSKDDKDDKGNKGNKGDKVDKDGKNENYPPRHNKVDKDFKDERYVKLYKEFFENVRKQTEERKLEMLDFLKFIINSE